MDKKAALLRWQSEHQIPGKIQSFLTGSHDPTGDWCLRNVLHGRQHRLDILGPSEQINPPEIVDKIYDYLIQEHQYYLRKSMLQMWIRATAPGEYALLLQAQIRGAGTGHAIKLLENHLTRNVPEVVALHRVETKPWYPFRTDLPPKSMKYDLKPIFGPEILPLGDTGHFFHILEWVPQLRNGYFKLPERLLGAIHPMPGDRLLELHCGSGFLGCQMAKYFEEVVCVDARGISKLSVLHNIKARRLTNVQYLQESVDAEFLATFFKKKGPWTVILNPQAGESLPTGIIRNIAAGPVGRVIHIGSNLDVLEAEIRRYRRAGMLLRKMIPLDLNPTSNRLEIALFFAPDREGVLKMGSEAVKKAAEAENDPEHILRGLPAARMRRKPPVKPAETPRGEAPKKPVGPRFVQKDTRSPIGGRKKRV
jgi:protein-L-isoaspartate O-methyltransferase